MSKAATKIIEKIMKLRAKAADDAASESEAMAAIEYANKLMEAYEVSEVDLAMMETDAGVSADVTAKDFTVNLYKGRFSPFKKNHAHPAMRCAVNVAKVTGTYMVRDPNTKNGLKIFGTEHGIAYAEYLLDIIFRAMENEYGNYKKQVGYVGRGAGTKSTFQHAMARQINIKLEEMTKAKRNAYERPETMITDRRGYENLDKEKFALVYRGMVDTIREKVDELVKETYQSGLRSSTYQYRVTDRSAYIAGSEAGSRVQLNAGVNSSGGTRMIAAR